MAGSPDSANDVDLRQDFDGTNLECLLLQVERFISLSYDSTTDSNINAGHYSASQHIGLYNIC